MACFIIHNCLVETASCSVNGSVSTAFLATSTGTMASGGVFSQAVQITHTSDQHSVPLAQFTAISSSFLAAGTHNAAKIFQDLASTEELQDWAVLAAAGEESV